MLKKLILVILFLIPALFTFSQNFNGGLILGMNMSQVDGDGHGGYSKLNFQAGALVSLQVSEKSSFQMEMEYIGKGSKPMDSLGNDFLLRFSYLEIPLLYQYTFAKRFSVEAGPGADVLLGSYEESNGQEQSSVIPLRPVTLTGIFGGSVFLSGNLKFNIRFNYSILSIRKPADVHPPEYRKVFFEKGQYNNVIEFSLLYYFKKREF